MSTPFAEYEDMVSDAVDDIHGERVRVVPMVDSKYHGRGESPDHEPFEVIGVVDTNPLMAQVTDKGQYDGFQPNIGADKVHVSVDVHRFNDYTPRAGDTLELLDRIGADQLPRKVTVKDPQPDGLGRIVLIGAWL